MSAISVRLLDELKDKAMRLAKKKNMSFNTLVNYWLQAAVQQDETIEWISLKKLTRRLTQEYRFSIFSVR